MQHWKASTRIILILAAVLVGGILLSLPSAPVSLAQQNQLHTVQLGETLESIAAIYDVSVEALREANELPADAVLFPGQQLVIPSVPPPDAEQPANTPTPRSSTADSLTDDVTVIDTGPTAIPITPVPTPLPYDPSRIITILEPDPDRRFSINLEPVAIQGVVQFDPETMDFWKLEIRGRSSRSRIWQNNDPMHSVPAFDWVTVNTGTEPVIVGELGLIPPFPTLSEGRWDLRVVAVNKDGTFADLATGTFSVDPEFDAVVARIDDPLDGAVVQAGTSVTGTLIFNFAISTYRIEIIGGNYTEWSTIAHVPNNPADPINITQGTIANLPVGLVPGRYRMRLIVNNQGGNYIQEPFEVAFAVGTNEVSNLAEIHFTAPDELARRDRIRTTIDTPITGTVIIPEGGGYYKLEIKDSNDLADGQSPRFTDWTTIGEPQTESANNSLIGTAPGSPGVPPGNYLMRVVVVNDDGSFSAVREFELEVQP